MVKLFAALIRLRVLILLIVLLATLFTGITLFRAHASPCAKWYHCPITQRYGHNKEHGVDLWTQGLPITALRSGVITFSHKECWDGECVMDITWKLDQVACYRSICAKYMYVQIHTSSVWQGEHVHTGQKIGMSEGFIEIGFTKSSAYGVKGNWYTDWTFDPLKIWPHL